MTPHDWSKLPKPLPCPHCGGERLGVVCRTHRDFRVVCNDCLAAGPSHTERVGAVERWNQRVAAEPPATPTADRSLTHIPGMMVVWKYLLTEGHRVDSFRLLISMPRGASILSVGLDPSENPAMWALVDPEQPHEKRRVAIYGTGCEMSSGDNFVGTYKNGGLVWHLFDAGPFS